MTPLCPSTGTFQKQFSTLAVLQGRLFLVMDEFLCLEEDQLLAYHPNTAQWSQFGECSHLFFLKKINYAVIGRPHFFFLRCSLVLPTQPSESYRTGTFLCIWLWYTLHSAKLLPKVAIPLCVNIPYTVRGSSKYKHLLKA